MDLERDLVFCFIEEDNTQRAYFRVRPLLTVQGQVQEEAGNLWPDDGCLRIVPDRNEQHTFKERMRTLGGYCVMDLQGIPATVNKIRTNKNYSPEKGESNQFILYSDTVKPLPEHTFFQVLEGSAADFATLAEQAITPLFYIRQDDTLFGPIRKADPQQPETAQAAEGMLFPVTCPDEKERILLCIRQPESHPAPESLPIGKPLEILDKSRGFEETLSGLNQPLSRSANLLRQTAEPDSSASIPVPQDKPLSGTPLFKSNMRTSTPQPKNKLQEVVAAQWRVARNEPPAEPLPADAQMRQVENPVEVACTSMRTAWQMPEARGQLVDFLFSLDGMRTRLDARHADECEPTALQKILHNRLQDIEAERLSLLLQLDKAKGDLESYRRTVIEQLSTKATQEINALTKQKADLEASVASLTAQQETLSAQRNELAHLVDDLQAAVPSALAKAIANAQLTAPVEGTPLHLNPVVGQTATADEMIRRIEAAFAASGVTAERNEIIALLVLMATSSRIGLTTDSIAAGCTLFTNVMSSLGWNSGFAHQMTVEQKPVVAPAPQCSTPAILLTNLASYTPIAEATKVFVARSTANQVRTAAYEASSWPILPLNLTETVPLVEASQSPISREALFQLLTQRDATPAEVTQALLPLMKLLPPISGNALREMHRFVATCSALMEGGFAAACDWAILLWLLPLVDRNPKLVSTIKPLLEEYPRALSAL